MMFIGMVPPPHDPKNTTIESAKKVEGIRHTTQDLHEQEYQQALITTKDKIRETEGPDMKENMQEQIRQWFIECRYVLQSISV